MRGAHPGEVRALIRLAEGSHCDTAFAAVEEAFAANFADHGELGASLCVHVDGMRVVDLAAGFRDRERRVGWRRDTLVNAFSVGKGITALLTALAVQDGRLDYDDRVTRHWPAFGGGARDRITVSDLLAHRAGLPALDPPLTDDDLWNWDAVCAALADTEPWWEPGEAHGYHVNTFGFLVGEVVRRAAGMRIEDMLRLRLAEPHGLGLFFGVPADATSRVADLVWPHADTARTTSEPVAPQDSERTHETMRARAYAHPPGFSGIGLVNTPRWRSLVHPSTALHADAAGVAGAHALMLGRRGLLSHEILGRAVEEQAHGEDLVLGGTTRFARGFQLPTETRRFGPHDGAFGHWGAGGALGFCDPEAGIAFGYVMNLMGDGWQNPRNRRLVDALYACL